MVTARMAAEKKRRGASVLTRDGLSASQAINLMYDRLIDEGEADFLFSSAVSYTHLTLPTKA